MKPKIPTIKKNPVITSLYKFDVFIFCLDFIQSFVENDFIIVAEHECVLSELLNSSEQLITIQNGSTIA